MYISTYSIFYDKNIKYKGSFVLLVILMKVTNTNDLPTSDRSGASILWKKIFLYVYYICQVILE